MAKSLFRKNPMNNMGDRLLKGAIRGGATLGGLALSNKTQMHYPKLHGPLLMLVGLVLDSTVDHDMAEPIAHGLQSAGAVITAANYLPDELKEHVFGNEAAASTSPTVDAAGNPVAGIGAANHNWEEMASNWRSSYPNGSLEAELSRVSNTADYVPEMAGMQMSKVEIPL